MKVCLILSHQVMVELFESVLDSLKSSSPNIKLVSSVAIVYCASVLTIDLPLSATALALDMIRLRPNGSNKSCSELQFLCRLIPEGKRW